MLFKKDKYDIIPSEFRARPIYRRLPHFLQRWSDRLWATAQSVTMGAFRLSAHVPPRLGLLLLLVAGAGIGACAMCVTMDRRRASAEVVVTIDGETISAPAFYHRLEILTKRSAIDQLAREALLLKLAETRRALPSAAQVEARLRETKQTAGFVEYAQRNHLTEDDLRRASRLALAKDNLLRGSVTTGLEPFMAGRQNAAQFEIDFAAFRSRADIRVCDPQFSYQLTGVKR